VCFDHRIVFEQREKSWHGGAKTILFLEPIPIDRNLGWIFRYQPTNNRITEVAGDRTSDNSGDFGVIQRGKINVRINQLSNSLIERAQILLNQLEDCQVWRIGAQK